MKGRNLRLSIEEIEKELGKKLKKLKLLKKSVEVENGKAKINMSEELNRAMVELVGKEQK